MINNRICPSEKILSEYLSNVLSSENRNNVENHLSTCSDCRQLVSETHEVLNKPSLRFIKHKITARLKTNQWIIGASIAFICSFLFPKYFLQFLSATLIMSAKWIIDAKTTKMLITIYEAWKSGTSKKDEESFSFPNQKK